MTDTDALADFAAHHDPGFPVLADADTEGGRRLVEIGAWHFEPLHHDIGEMDARHFWLRFGSQQACIEVLFHVLQTTSKCKKSFVFRGFCVSYVVYVFAELLIPKPSLTM